jgi:iron complex outermembrane recepter protein
MQIIFLLVFCFVSVFAVAQDISTTLPAKEEEKEEMSTEQKVLKKIEVTGSYIKRVDEEAPNPVQTISSETLQKSGHNSVADVLRETAYTQQTVREDSLSTNPGVATASIGPFSASQVLVLMDGQRLPKVGGENFVDLNTIPMAAIERVDILKDGASALYGSDAVGGVMNFITKKNFNGASVNLTQNLAGEGGGARSDVAISVGRTFKKGNVLGVVQYRSNEELSHQDREFSRIKNVAAQGSPTGNFGSWQDVNTGTNNPSSFCPAENLDSNGFCRFDYSKYSWGMPAIQQANAMLTGSYKFNEYLKSKSTATIVRREVQTQLAPSPDTMKIDKDTAINKLGLATTGDVLIRYRIADEAGPRRELDTTNTISLAQTFEGKIAGSWTYDFSGTYGRYSSASEGTGYADKSKIISKIKDGSYNPLAAPGLKGSIADTLFTSTRELSSSQTEVRLVTTGQLYEGGDSFGPIAMAIGTSAARQDFSTEVDAVRASKNAYGTVGSFGAGSRNFQSVFQELSMFPIESVEVGLAARFDNYSDFGQTVNPKLSLSWQVTDKFMFRSSAGTGFRAPDLVDLYNSASYGFPQMIDSVYCQKQIDANAGDAAITQACLNQQQLVNFTPDPNLRQESSVFYNVGFLAQPKKNWNIEGNFWIANIKDRVGTLEPTYAIMFEEQFGAQRLQELYGIIIPRTPDGQLDPSGIVMPSAFNLPTQNLRGLDFRVSHEAKARLLGKAFNVSFVVDHLHMLQSKTEDFPGLGIRGYRNINWRNTATLGFNRNAHSFRFITRTISGGDKSFNEFEVGRGSLPTFTTHDLTYTYANLFGGALNMGIRNLMAYNQPLDNTEFSPADQLDGTQFDPLGRVYYMGYSYTF